MRTLWIAALSTIIAAIAGCDTAQRGSIGAAAQKRMAPEAAGPAAAAPPMTASPECDAGRNEADGPKDEIGATLRRLFDEADTNRDGQLSKVEGSSFATSMVEREFTRADANRDGQVTPAEAREARMQFKREHPRLSLLLDEVRAATGQTPFTALALMAAVDASQPVKREDVLRITQAAVDEAFRTADTNHDGMLSRAEVKTATTNLARQTGELAFKAADKNRDGKLSFEELRQALTPAAKSAFDLADTNKDGVLSPEETNAAGEKLSTILGM